MKIGFIGIGNVGGSLARRLGKSGHSIYLGARNPEDAEAKQLAASIGSNASVLSVHNAVKESEVILLATPWVASLEIVKQMAEVLSGKILIDATNPLKPDFAGLDFDQERSGAEQIQLLIPETNVIKAFNTVGFNIMAAPILENRKVAMYFCGDNAGAKNKVKELIEDVGFEPIDGGPLKSARLLEPFALLWISSAYKFGLGRDFAFSLVRR